MHEARPRTPPEIYEQYFVPAMFMPWAGTLLRHAAPRPAERLLDVACGTGIVARLAAPMVGAGGGVTGLDLNPAMLAVAAALPPAQGASIQWQGGNAQAMPFPDGAFDLVLCQHGLQFMPDRAAVAKEMLRVLAPAGRAAVMVLQSLELHPVFRKLMESVALRLALPITEFMTPFNFPNPEALASLFLEAGFHRVQVVPETVTVRFPDARRFVPLAAASSAAAVPAFAQLSEPERAELLAQVQADVEPTLLGFREADTVSFPMVANLALAVAPGARTEPGRILEV